MSWLRCYGELGRLSMVGDKVQCHACGGSFHHLGAHVSRTHDMSADAYCDQFGLKRTTGLISPSLAEKRRASAWWKDGVPAEVILKSQAFRHQHGSRRGLKASLEERLVPGYREAKSAQGTRLQSAAAQARKDGRYRQYINPGLAEMGKRGREVRRHLDTADPSRLVAWKRKLSAAHSVPVSCPCVVCGSVFTTLSSASRKTCGDTCLTAYRRAHAAAHLQTEPANQKRASTAKRRAFQRDAHGRIQSWVREDA